MQNKNFTTKRVYFPQTQMFSVNWKNWPSKQKIYILVQREHQYIKQASYFESFLLKWFSNLLLTAETTTARGTLRDMKNLRIELFVGLKRKIPEKVVDDFDPTEDGETSEKTHCASNQSQLGFHCHLRIIIRILIIVMSISPSRLSQSHHRLPCQNRCTLPPADHSPVTGL